MDLTQLTSHAPARFFLPFVVFGCVLSAFKVIESNTSQPARSRLSKFIKSNKYENYLGVLPEVIQTGFNKIMGTTHLSRKCVARSLIFSLISSALAIGFSVIYNYHDVASLISSYPKVMVSIHDTILKNPKLSQFAFIIDKLSHARFVLPALVPLWVAWCLIPDFVALLKTRVVLLVLRHTNPSSGSLFVVFAVDILLTIVLFVLSFVTFQIIVGYMVYFYVYGAHSSDALVSFVLSVFLFAIEFSVLVLTDAIFFNIPIANIFWASALPSVWVWVYVFAALSARVLLLSKPFLRLAVYLLDFEEKPISSLGMFAGFIGGLATSLFLLATLLI